MKTPWKKSEQNAAQDAPSGSTRASDLLKDDAVQAQAAAPAATEPDREPAAEKKPAHQGAGSQAATQRKGYTPPKGRPTPKRRDREIERGVVRDPNKLTPAEASKRRKELKKSMSKEEWKEYKRKEREESRERNRIYRERLYSGDERYLMERDKGDERRYARDWVDSKRFFNNLFLPVALIMLLSFFLTSVNPMVANVVSSILMIAVLVFLIEGIFIGIRVNKAVRAKYPNTTDRGFGMGFYAFSRATQPRKWRTPRPRVAVGDRI
ncbi:DUF3043 domain-containing protein [Corynebacterium tapiri]|uniref:DUF3043 domain-containing protein n=1 Tax=Corynebacterium tapiri TaxID=1448266 RepID=A0A5C4U5R7_9CORY|nr:DUF3043 domain-containing protein [Corynebacterium tapiri]TNL99428.1 DUF3043 domain-containing protein [Corynebacterium tapiri]